MPARMTASPSICRSVNGSLKTITAPAVTSVNVQLTSRG